jgi:hypothetical protein
MASSLAPTSEEKTSDDRDDEETNHPEKDKRFGIGPEGDRAEEEDLLQRV